MTLPSNTHADVLVQINDNIRLLASLLALTDHPQQAQQRKPHGTHAHARACQKQLAPYAAHEAAMQLQRLLDQGVPLEAIFTRALSSPVETDPAPEWLPPRWDEHLMQFERDAALAAWWRAEVGAWEQSREQIARVFDGLVLKPFFKPFFGDVRQRLIVMPNIAYPTNTTLALRGGTDLVCVIPPRVAWGDNPPWPFDEDPAHVYGAAVNAFARLLMLDCPLANDDRLHTRAQLVTAGLVALFLEDQLSGSEAKAYALMQRKVNGIDVQPAVDGLRAFRAEVERGQAATLLDFLPARI